MAHNEAANISKVLEALSEQKTARVEIDEILVISSGSTDGTDDIVRSWERRDPRIRLLRQERREGKASAVNLFLHEARNDILVLESADTLPLADTIERLVMPLADDRVGMTGAHPVPLNPRTTFLGGVVHLMWGLHHLVALEAPKLGEMVAFKKMVTHIPRDSAVDEASLEAALRQEGLELVYVPEAIVYNRGPENLKDFLVQRRRIQAGHLWLEANCGYKVSTTRAMRILRHLMTLTPRSAWGLVVAVGAIALEALGRALGCLDFWVLGKNPFVWKTAPSTKDLRCQGSIKLI
ncbi:MAG TPA: glycosyltransferase [Syntrophobacteria bacterium]|nr:glycosyltransferase [Syntrophobacteria bacterium]